ncbi:hypothetical protein [Caldimonas brevitalea]|nr:hypothetical protein [Caldimonas brevitalea]
MTTSNRRRFLSLCAAGALSLSLAACGGGGGDDDHHHDDPDESPVFYAGTTLVVDGVSYPQEPAPPYSYFAGTVVVEVDHEDEDIAADTLDWLGLRVLEYDDTNGLWVVEVRQGFEVQWARALAEQDGIREAYLNGAHYRAQAAAKRAAAKRLAT